jgi:RHS repeat-associated protein
MPGVTTMTGDLYDADGTRVAKGTISTMSCDPTANGFQFTENYVLGPGGEQVTELAQDANGSMNWQRTYVYAGGALIATYGPVPNPAYSSTNTSVPQTLYLPSFRFTDWLGTMRATTDSTGVAQGTCTGLPFGDGVTCQGDIPDPHHFTGKERDTESGNDYFEARYYSSSMGRFMSPDWSAKAEPVPYAKMDNPQSLNLYAYVLNNPLSKVDPDGHLGCGFLWLGNCPAPPPPPPPPPTPKPPPVPPPPPLTYKPNVPVPAPNTGLGKLLQCTNQCMNPTPIGVSSTSETVPGHPEIHGPDTPHGRGEAADLTPGKKEAKQTMWCSAQCGAGFGQNEYDHPSAHATGGHDHVQTGEGRGGSRGDLPADEHPEQPQEQQ